MLIWLDENYVPIITQIFKYIEKSSDKTTHIFIKSIDEYTTH